MKKHGNFSFHSPPRYQRTNIYRVMPAKQENTRASRLEKLIAERGGKTDVICFAYSRVKIFRKNH